MPVTVVDRHLRLRVRQQERRIFTSFVDLPHRSVGHTIHCWTLDSMH